MKSPLVLLLLTFILLVGSSIAQSRANIAFDLRPDAGDTSTSSGSARSRVVKHSEERTNGAARAIEREVFELLNTERSKNGLKALEWSDEVAAVARLHSQNMANAKFFSHRGSDGSMVDDRADRLGLGAWKTIGENIAYMRGFDDPAAVAVEKWLESTAHRKNLLGPNWQESAVGVAVTEDGTYYMTQVFLLRK